MVVSQRCSTYTLKGFSLHLLLAVVFGIEFLLELFDATLSVALLMFELLNEVGILLGQPIDCGLVLS